MVSARRKLNTEAKVAMFERRCEESAKRYARGEVDLLDAVDGLQAQAVKIGLVREIGQGAVQWLMHEAFQAILEVS